MLYRTSLSAPVFGLRREIDRLFEDTFGRGEGVSNWSPAVDVRETDQELALELELPGIKPDEVELTAENGVLTVRGEKTSERKEGDENSRYHVVERSYGNFTRSFQLPQGIDESKIEADYNNGILTIHIPKTALPQARRIQIGNRNNKQQQAQVSGQTTTKPNGQKTESNSQPTRSTTTSRSRETETEVPAR